jgi:hypothetical protein
VALRIGVTMADLKAMTRAQLLSVSHGAVGTDANARKSAANRARVDFFRTLDEIRARLEKEAACAAAEAKEGRDGDAGE